MGVSRYLRRSRWDAERDRELEAHLAIETDENIARGMPPAEARDAARRKLGSALRVREEIYDMNTLPFLETARLDVRDAARQLRRRPSVTVLALLLLTIGIGASATAFSVAYGVLWRPLPFPDSDRLAVLWAQKSGQQGQISLPDFYDLRAAVPFGDAAALASGRATVSAGSSRSDAERLTIVNAEPSLLRLLGTRPRLGRLPVEADEGQPVVAISERLWRRVFGSDPGVVGHSLTISGAAYTVIGVVDSQFEFELPVPAAGGVAFTVKDVDLWTPFDLVAGVPLSRDVSMCEVLIRLKPGETLASTQTAIDTVASRLASAYPATNRGRSFVLAPLHDEVVKTKSSILAMALAGALLLLLIACANVVSVFLADLPLRRRDFALRAALGAGRARLLRQVVIESAMLAIAGSGIGLWLAHAAVAWLKSSTDLPRVDAIRFDPPVTAAIVAAAVVVSLFARLIPLVRIGESCDELRTSLSAYSSSAPQLRRVLVGVQVALAVVLSCTALLLGLSLRRLIAVDPGFAASHAVAVRVAAYGARYDKAATTRFVGELVERISGLPGIEAAAAGQSLPLAGAAAGTSIAVEGQPVAAAERPTAGWFTVTPGYFRTLGAAITSGREFAESDRVRSTHQTLINQTLARRLFGSQNPIGRRVQYGPDSSQPDWHEIVGVVADVRQSTLDSPPQPAAYDLFGQHWGRSVYLVARGNADPYTLVPSIRQIVQHVDPEAPVFDVRSLDDIVNGAVSPRRVATGFATALATISLALAAIGLYGLLAGSVASRTKELGIRRALGCSTRQIVRLVVGEAAALAAVGVAAGAAATFAVARPVQAQLFAVRSTDIRVLATVAVGMAIVAALASYVPARRAAAVDPAAALRNE